MKRRNRPFKDSPAEPLAVLSRVLIIINPAAGSRRKRAKLKVILEHLKGSAAHLEIAYTSSVLDATRLIREKRKDQWSLILCAGGDGTINEVVNGLMDETSPAAFSPLPPLGILPTGTGNGLAREIGIPLDPLDAYEALLTGSPRPVFTGRVRTQTTHQSPTERPFDDRYFVLMAGVGFDGFVTDRVDQRKGLFRSIPKLWIYFIFGFAALFSYSYPTLHFDVDGAPYTGSTGIVAKARLVWGRYQFAPTSNIASPSLVLCLFKPKSIAGYLRILTRFIFSGTAEGEIEYIEGKEITALGANEPVQADGELIGGLPALFSVSRKPIHLIYPTHRI